MHGFTIGMRGCASYASQGWCASGKFVYNKRWTGDPTLGPVESQASDCAQFMTPANGNPTTCAELYGRFPHPPLWDGMRGRTHRVPDNLHVANDSEHLLSFWCRHLDTLIHLLAPRSEPGMDAGEV